MSDEQPPVAPETPPSEVRGNGRELLLGGATVVGAAVLTLAMLMTRGAPTTSAAAPAPVAPKAAEPAVPAPMTEETAAAPAWTDANASLWLGRGRPGVAFEVRAEKPVSAWMRTVHPILVVRCTAGSAQAFVVTNTAAQIEANTEAHTVTFSFDDQPETRQRWEDSTEHDALFAPDGGVFAQRLMASRTLRFGFTPHNASPVSARFNVTGLEPLIFRAKACGWK